MFDFWKHILSRAAIICASFVVTSLLMLAIGAAIHGASSQHWLRDTPQARHAVARCMAHDDRAAEHACLRTLVAEARARDAGTAQMAALDLPRPASSKEVR